MGDSNLDISKSANLHWLLLYIQVSLRRNKPLHLDQLSAADSLESLPGLCPAWSHSDLFCESRKKWLMMGDKSCQTPSNTKLPCFAGFCRLGLKLQFPFFMPMEGSKRHATIKKRNCEATTPPLSTTFGRIAVMEQ